MLNRRVLAVIGALLLSAGVATQASAAPSGAEPDPDCTLVGTPGDDFLFGTDGDDVICGLGGDDVISGGKGDDVIRAGDGHDFVDDTDAADVVDSAEVRITNDTSDTSFARSLYEAGLLAEEDLPATVPVRTSLTTIDCGALGPDFEANQPVRWDGETALVTRYRLAISEYLATADPDAFAYRDGDNGVVVKTVLPTKSIAAALEEILANQRYELAIELLRIENANMERPEKNQLEETWHRDQILTQRGVEFRLAVSPRCTTPDEQVVLEDEAKRIADSLLASDADPTAVVGVSVHFNRVIESPEVELISEIVPDEALQESRTAAFPGNVRVTHVEPDKDAAGNRWNETSAHWGGASVRNANTTGRCTTGFAMTLNQNSTQRLITTAGHCSATVDPNSGLWFGQNGVVMNATTNAPTYVANQYYGNTVLNQIVYHNSQSNPTGADVTLIGNGGHQYHRLVWLSEQSVPSMFAFFVSDKLTTINTNTSTASICMNGGTIRNNRCATTILPLSVRQAGGTHWENVYRASPAAGVNMCDQGDSGAALWVNVGGSLRIVGSFTATSGASNCAFLRIGEVEAELGAQVETMLGASSSW